MHRGIVILVLGGLASVAAALLVGFLQQHLAPDAGLAILWSMASAFLLAGSLTIYLFWQITIPWRWRPALLVELQGIVDDLEQWDEADFAMFENALKMMNAVPTIATFSVTRGDPSHRVCDKMRVAGLLSVPLWWASSRKPDDDGVVYELHPSEQQLFEEVVVAGYEASLKRRGIVLKRPATIPATA